MCVGALGRRARTSLSLSPPARPSRGQCQPERARAWEELSFQPLRGSRAGFQRSLSRSAAATLTQSRFRCQGKCQTGRRADTHRPPPKEVGIWVPQLPNLPDEWPRQSAPAMEQSEEEEAAKGMWCAISAAIKGESPCQLVAALPAPCQKRKIIFKGNMDKRPAACMARGGGGAGRGGGCRRGLRGPFMPRASSFQASVPLRELLLLLKVQVVPGKKSTCL